MRKVILTSNWKDKKIGDIIDLDNDEASLVVNTGFGHMHPDTVKAEEAIAKKQAETPMPAYKPPDVSIAAAKKVEQDKADAAKKAEEARKVEAAKRSGR